MGEIEPGDEQAGGSGAQDSPGEPSRVSGRQHPAGAVQQPGEQACREEFPDEEQRARRRTVPADRRHGEQVERDQQGANGIQGPGSGGELQAGEGVPSGGEQPGGEAVEHAEFQEGAFGNLIPETEDQRERAREDHQAPDQFPPVQVALFHEGQQPVGPVDPGTGGWCRSGGRLTLGRQAGGWAAMGGCPSDRGLRTGLGFGIDDFQPQRFLFGCVGGLRLRERTRVCLQ